MKLLLEAALVVRGQDDSVVVVRRHVVREVPVRRVEVEGDGQVVHLPRAALRQHAAEGRQRVGPVGRVGQPVERRGDVVRRERAAVMELDAGAQGEGPDRAVLVRLPRGCQGGTQLQVRPVIHQEVRRLMQDAQCPDVRAGHRVNRAGGRDLRDAYGGAGLALRLRPPDQRQPGGVEHRSHEGRGQAERRPVHQEGAPAHPARQDLVGDVVLQVAAGLPQVVQLGPEMPHRSCSRVGRRDHDNKFCDGGEEKTA